MQTCKDEWRKFISPTCPGPRSAHAAATTSSGGGKLFLFGMISQTLSANVENPLSSVASRRGGRWGVFVPVSEQFSSLQRFLVF